MNRYVANADFTPSDGTQLAFKTNDILDILSYEEDWWFGKLLKNGNQGWVPASYLRLATNEANTEAIEVPVEFAPLQPQYSAMNSREKLACAETVYANMMNSEMEFVNQIKMFLDTLVAPLQVKDTVFKRNFLGEYSIAVCFSLMNDIQRVCSHFVTSLKSAKQGDMSRSVKNIATCIAEFCPALRTFATYISEHSNALNALKSHTKGLNDFLLQHTLPMNTSIESFLLLPVGHYSSYREVVGQWLQLCRAVDQDADKDLLLAERTFLSATQEGDAKLAAEREKHMLLAVQSQCKEHMQWGWLSYVTPI